MTLIKIDKTYDVKLSGQPSLDVDSLPLQPIHGLHPYRIPNITPKLLIKENDSVKIGTPLFFDKKQPEVVFSSPVAGKVTQIVFGPRRRIDKIEITTTESQEAEVLDVPDVSSERVSLVQSICKAGLWGAFRTFPFQAIAKIDATPSLIVLSVDNDEPHHPNSSIILDKYLDEFKKGLSVLNALSENKVVVGISSTNNDGRAALGSLITHVIEGDYPANDPGVLLYKVKTSVKENSAWTLTLQEVVRLGQLFLTKTYPSKRIVCLAGAKAIKPRHFEVIQGTPVRAVVGDVDESATRLISGGVFTGTKISNDDFIGFYDDALHCLQESGEQEFMAFMTPGFNKASYSRAFMSSLFKKPSWALSSLINGGERACIECGYCEEVCPVDLTPQAVMKRLAGKDIESALDFGLLDCVDCGLCTYVCPSKIELGDLFLKTKSTLLKEVEK
ncbi:4Fe-4S dicluster domain-containing protein [bacterium]|jgi:Na+-transporting NADH:ubiquinone oxidoreductase subunit A|nr:4Fe-4S dicluster domain-containing protein [bacterium]